MLFKKKKTHYLCIFKNAGSLNQKGLKCQITFSSIQYFSCKSGIIGFSILQEKIVLKTCYRVTWLQFVLMLQFLGFFFNSYSDYMQLILLPALVILTADVIFSFVVFSSGEIWRILAFGEGKNRLFLNGIL